jgi:hypothetical protein
MKKASSNKNLKSANRAKSDEFYTQLSDIEKELGNYKAYLSLNKHGKTYRLTKNGIKKTFQRLEIKGWKFIKAREYQNTYIFKSPDGNKYLHFGDPLKIKKVTDVQLNLYKKGYPVAQVLKTGNFGKYSYLLESSLGDEPYGDIFTRGIEGHTFQSFCNVVKTYFEAQVKNQLPASSHFDVRKQVMAENVIGENPDLDLTLIGSALDKLQYRLKTLPFTYSHGDFAARNILDKGIIDFEFYSIAPIGLDIFTVCAMEDFWMFKNENGEFHARFCYERHHNEYLIEVLSKVCSEHNLDRSLEYQDDFILFKAFWSTAHEKQQAINSGDETKWRFRRAVLMHCIEKYLKDEKIETSDFQSLNKI